MNEINLHSNMSGTSLFSDAAQNPEKFFTTIFDKVLTIMDQQGTTDNSSKANNHAPQLELPSDTLDMAEMIAHLKSKISKDMEKVAKENIEVNRADQKAKSEERVEKLMEAIDSMKAAKTWGVIGSVIGYITSIGSMILGAALVVAGAATCWLGGSGVGLAVAGVGLIGGGAVGLAATIASDTGLADMAMDAMAGAFEDMGMSKEAAKWLAFGLYTATVMVATVAASLVGVAALIPGGINAGVQAGKTAVEQASKITIKVIIEAVKQFIKNMIKNIVHQMTHFSLEMVNKSVEKLVKALAVIAQDVLPALFTATSSVAGSSASLGEALWTMDASNKKADAIDISALLKKLQQDLEEQAAQLQAIMESSQKGISIVTDMIKTHDQAFNMTLQV